MALLGGAHGVVGARVEQRPHRLELRGGAVGEGLRGDPLARRRLLHLEAMFVHAGDEQHVASVEPHEPGDRVGGDAFIGVADMGRAIGVGNRGRDVEAAALGHRLKS